MLRYKSNGAYGIEHIHHTAYITTHRAGWKEGRVSDARVSKKHMVLSKLVLLL